MGFRGEALAGWGREPQGPAGKWSRGRAGVAGARVTDLSRVSERLLSLLKIKEQVKVKAQGQWQARDASPGLPSTWGRRAGGGSTCDAATQIQPCSSRDTEGASRGGFSPKAASGNPHGLHERGAGVGFFFFFFPDSRKLFDFRALHHIKDSIK